MKILCRNPNSRSIRNGPIMELADHQSKTVLAFRQRVTLNGKTHLLKVVASRTAKSAGILGPGTETIYSLETDPQKITLQSLKVDFHVIVYQNPPFVVVYLSFENTTAKPVAIGDIHLFETVPDAPVSIGGKVKRGTRYVYVNNFKDCWVQGLGRRLVGHGISVIYNLDSKVSLNTSFMTFNQMKSMIITDFDKRKGCLKSIDIYQSAGSFILQPRRRLTTDWLYVDVSRNPQLSLERYADQVARYYKTNPRTPAKVGWNGCASAYYSPAPRETYEEKAKRNIKAVKRRLRGLDVNHIWVSICNYHKEIPMEWEKNTLENQQAFPKGFVQFCTWLRQEGIKLGLWSLPFSAVSASKMFTAHPEFILKGLDGKNIPYVGEIVENNGKFSRWGWPFGRYL